MNDVVLAAQHDQREDAFWILSLESCEELSPVEQELEPMSNEWQPVPGHRRRGCAAMLVL